MSSSTTGKSYKRFVDELVLTCSSAVFKGTNKNDYVQAAATYELAAIAWDECGHPPEGVEDETAYRKDKLKECEAALDKAKNWEAYNLDMRIGLRIQSGLETIRWFRRRMGWPV